MVADGMDLGDPRSTRTTLRALGLVLILLGGIALAPRILRSEGSGPTAAGGVAPDFTLGLVANGGALVTQDATRSAAPTGASGATAAADPGHDPPTKVTLSQLRGHTVLLDFWATWCAPCRAEAPIVDQVSRRWRDRGVQVIGVSTDIPGQGDPGGFARAKGLSYPIVQDAAGEAARLYGVENLPTLVVVSATGKIVAVRMGMTDDTELERLIRRAGST